ncbi:MAG: nitroreductase family deazaflavin-dependent oxidoreductase [Actinomycetota bacterium]|nr:nitroreductase family deazaflavin-dependent oxidoreductase [Actinomycetota bacterium]
MGRLTKWLERLTASRPGGAFFLHVATRIDRVLMRLTGGRVKLALRRPVLLLGTTGARTGARRTTPLLYAVDGEHLVLVGSNAARSSDPGWCHNLRANPDVTVEAPGRSGRYRAHVAQGEERERLWRHAVAAYAGYAVYERRTKDRQIPVVVLTPVEAPRAGG